MRLPLAVFIIIIPVLWGVGFAIFYSAFTTHAHGDYFRLETNHLDLDFPRNWYAVPWEEKNSSGDRYGVLLAPTDIRASMFMVIYDENAARLYLEQNNVTDAFSATIFELKRLHNWALQKNENATLSFIENETISLFGHTGNCSTLIMEGGFVDDQGKFYNWTWTFMSFIDGKIFQIAYHGVEGDYDLAYRNFQFILNSTKIKLGEEK